MEWGQAVSTECALDKEAQANQAAECKCVSGPSRTSRGINQLHPVHMGNPWKYEPNEWWLF